MDGEILHEFDVDWLISEIVSRTRTHPSVARGASVRGTIAFKEVLQGLSDIHGGITLDSINKAAIITLPSRISLREGEDKTALVTDIVKEVLYGIPFPRTSDETIQPVEWSSLLPENIIEGLKNLKRLSQEQIEALAQKGQPTVIDDPDKIKYLEDKRLKRKRKQNQYSLSKKTLNHLLNELERKLKDGEITPEAYNREKGRLLEMLRNASKPKFRTSVEDLANTIMELMEAQDGQWGNNIDFERMYIYYHIKANRGEQGLNPKKHDYYGLRMLIEDLEEQGILRTEGTDNDFVLTSEALHILLEFLIERDTRGEGLRGTIDFEKTLLNERRHEIRRYSSGDVFRDISFRHTLREIVRQKKSLSGVKRSDFRVFMTQPRKLKSDIVLCLDTSGSMAFQQKLMYARIAAMGLAKAAIEDGDRVGLIAFDSISRTAIPFSDKETIFNYIIRLSAHGNTNIGEGIKRASRLLFQDRSHNQKHILLITDGQPTALSKTTFEQLKGLEEKDLSEESVILEARKAAAKGIVVSVIHIAGQSESSSQFVKKIALAGRGKVRRMSTPEDLRAIMH